MTVMGKRLVIDGGEFENNTFRNIVEVEGVYRNARYVSDRGTASVFELTDGTLVVIEF